MHHLVSIRHHLFEPDPVRARVGDTISWRNDDRTVHTATSSAPGIFATGDIDSGAESEIQTLNQSSDHSGFSYYCDYHGSMSGTVFVEAAETTAQTIESEYPKGVWTQIAQIVAAFWVLDMSDDFAGAQATATGTDLQRIQNAWNGILSWWTTKYGSTPEFTDTTFLLAQSRDSLEAAGRKIRNAHLELRPLVIRDPDPNHTGNNGQSEDPLGEAITIFAGTQAAQSAFRREIAYVSAAFRIDVMQENGQAIPDQLKIQYQQRKAGVSADDYRILAQHQTERLQALLGGPIFDAAVFTEGMARLTEAGEWDDPPFSIWHWLRWIDAYSGVVDTGAVPDLVQIP